MYNLKLNRTPQNILLMTGILILSAISVGSEASQDKEDLFKKFYGAIRYIYFPGNQEDLDRCYIKQEKICIDTYKRAIEAKNRLFSYGNEAALDATLNAIDANCSGGKRDDAICNGAVYFLFFFNSSKFDTKILKYFSSAGNDVTRTVFDSGTGYWMHNRLDNSKWLKFVNSHKAFSDSKKQDYKLLFNDAFDHDIGIKLIKKILQNKQKLRQI